MLKQPQTWRLFMGSKFFAANHEHFDMMEIMIGCSQADSIIILVRWLGWYLLYNRIITDREVQVGRI